MEKITFWETSAFINEEDYLNENVENRKENVIIGSELLIYEHPHIYCTKLQKSSDDYRELVVVKLPYREQYIIISLYVTEKM